MDEKDLVKALQGERPFDQRRCWELMEKAANRIAELEALALKLGGQLVRRDELLQRALDEDDPDAGGMSSKLAADIAAELAPKDEK